MLYRPDALPCGLNFVLTRWCHAAEWRADQAASTSGQNTTGQTDSARPPLDSADLSNVEGDKELADGAKAPQVCAAR